MQLTFQFMSHGEIKHRQRPVAKPGYQPLFEPCYGQPEMRVRDESNRLPIAGLRPEISIVTKPDRVAAQTVVFSVSNFRMSLNTTMTTIVRR